MGPQPWYFSLADSLNPRNSPLPRVTNVDVKGLRQRTAKYSILFTPIATLPSSLLISHGSFKRCVPWGEIPGQKMKDDEMFGCHFWNLLKLLQVSTTCAPWHCLVLLFFLTHLKLQVQWSLYHHISRTQTSILRLPSLTMLSACLMLAEVRAIPRCLTEGVARDTRVKRSKLKHEGYVRPVLRGTRVNGSGSQ